VHKQARKGARTWGPGTRPPGKMAPPRPPANLPLSWRDVRRPRRVVGAGPGPLPASLRYHGPPRLPGGVAHRPPHQDAPVRYALGADPNERPGGAQHRHGQLIEAFKAIEASWPILLVAALGILLVLKRR